MSNIVQQDLWFTQSGNNLIIKGDGSDSLTINNHFYSSSYQIENINLSDGSQLSSAQISGLVNSMAAFASQQTAGLTTAELRDK